MSQPRIGIIGTGGMAEQRAHGFPELGARVVVVCGRDARKTGALAQSINARATSSVDELLDAVDAVAICLPNHLHVEFAERALSRGKHALVEYPLCCNEDE